MLTFYDAGIDMLCSHAMMQHAVMYQAYMPIILYRITVADIHTYTAHPVAGAELPKSIVSNFEYEADTRECYQNADKSTLTQHATSNDAAPLGLAHGDVASTLTQHEDPFVDTDVVVHRPLIGGGKGKEKDQEEKKEDDEEEGVFVSSISTLTCFQGP